jgi:hypothetical protein
VQVVDNIDIDLFRHVIEVARKPAKRRNVLSSSRRRHHAAVALIAAVGGAVGAAAGNNTVTVSPPPLPPPPRIALSSQFATWVNGFNDRFALASFDAALIFARRGLRLREFARRERAATAESFLKFALCGATEVHLTRMRLAPLRRVSVRESTARLSFVIRENEQAWLRRGAEGRTAEVSCPARFWM